MQKTNKRALLRGLLSALAFLGLFLTGVILLMLATQRDWMYHTEPPDKPASPEQYGAAGYSEVDIRTADGLVLNAWYRPPPDATAPVILVFHGNSGNVAIAHHRMLPFSNADTGAGFLFLDYREYGGNPGKATEAGLYADGRAAMRYLADELGIEPARVVLYGYSTGAAVAVQMATEFDTAALILASGFDNRVEWVLGKYVFLRPFRAFIIDEMPSAAKMKEVNEPTLFMHGTDDDVVDLRHGLALYAAAAGDRQFVAVEGAGHSDMFDFPETMQAIRAFLAAQGLVSLNPSAGADDDKIEVGRP